MGDSQSSDARDEGRKALRLGIFSTVAASAKVALAVTTAAGVVAGILGIKGSLSGDLVFLLVAVVVLSALISFYYCEFERFRYLRVLFKEVLNSEKNYEVLLTEARRERDDLSAALIKYRAEIEVVRATQMTIRATQNNQDKEQ